MRVPKRRDHVAVVSAQPILGRRLLRQSAMDRRKQNLDEIGHVWRQAGDVVGDTYRSLGTLSQAQPLLPAEAPLDAADIAHDGGDALADRLAKNWLPRHQL